MNISTQNGQNSSRRYTNGMLTAIVALLGMIAVNQGGSASSALAEQPPTQPARGDDGDSGERVSAAEQRKVMISELRAIGGRMDRMEALLNKGIRVKVTEMPPGTMSNSNDRAATSDQRKAK